MTFNRINCLIRLVYVLGLANVACVLLYRLKLSLGIIAKLTPLKLPIEGNIFLKNDNDMVVFPAKLHRGYIARADLLLEGYHNFFFSRSEFVGNPPKWRQWNEDCEGVHWSKTSINTTVDQDVKKTWDISRFHWMPTLAAAFAVTGDKKYLNTINSWFEDWALHNAPNAGVNWVCAQEVSIRLLNVLNASSLISQELEANNTFIDTILAHCERIYPTIDYAVAQDNNHGISEAAALYIAGNWLQTYTNNGVLVKCGRKFASRGNRVLEELVARLVSSDGGFSMYSLTYHRVVLDTLSLVEYWREKMSLEQFSLRYYRKVSNLVDFLFQMLDVESGDVPNIGANDGSRSYLLTDSDYRDFRPSIHMASGYFSDSRAYDFDKVSWFSADLPEDVKQLWCKKTHIFRETGFAALIPNTDLNTWGVARFPAFKFRPGQSDGLHFDLWLDGRNILTDSGTFSYNCSHKKNCYFSGAAGHNVVQFDNRESMPRVGKFLWGDWLKAKIISVEEDWRVNNNWASSFTDYLGATHCRKVHFQDDKWFVSDKLLGTFSQATLRWHLEDTKWHLNGNVIESDDVRILISADCPISIRLTQGWKSLYYDRHIDIPVLEVRVVSGPAELKTEIQLNK
jgi:hypothetical protein